MAKGGSNNWSLYVAGVGAIDAAETMLTNFVGKLRDLNLKITDVEVIGPGSLHPDLMDHMPEGQGENGWTFYVYGTGDVAVAYGELPMFLNEFKNNGIEVAASGIVQGERRQLPIGAGTT